MANRHAPGTGIEANDFGWPVRQVIKARYNPTRTDNLKDGAEAWIGCVGLFRYAFMGDQDEQYPEQYRWSFPDDWGPFVDPPWGPEPFHGGLWVPDEDLEIVE